jgi:hypothetical protein
MTTEARVFQDEQIRNYQERDLLSLPSQHLGVRSLKESSVQEWSSSENYERHH